MFQRNFKIGDNVRFTAAGLDNECYAKYHSETFTITAVSTRYMPSTEFFDKGKSAGYHPGYDSGCGCALYDLARSNGKSLPFSLYDYEIRRA